MKIFYLKQIRENCWSKYEIRKSNCPSDKDKPWRIHESPKVSFCEHYATREDAVKALMLLWHEDAEKFLWRMRTKRKRNKYPW